MRKVVYKMFWIWNYDKEEKWLNEMAAKGLALISVGLCRYEFEDCVPGEYKFCLEFLKGSARDAENEKYIEFIEETGAEHIGTFKGWAYFRKKGADGAFQLLSDKTSLIARLTRIIRFIIFLLVINTYSGAFNLFLYFRHNSSPNILGVINLLLSAFIAVGMLRLIRIRRQLKAAQKIYE